MSTTGGDPTSFASVILAAGAATRMGRPKMLLPLPGGATALAAAVLPHLEAGVDRVVVVLGHRAEEIRRGTELPEDARLRVVVNAGWEGGMASSLRLGIEECEGAMAALVALGDQVGVHVERVRSILNAWSPGCRLVVPIHGGRASHPVLFSRDLWPELVRLDRPVPNHHPVTVRQSGKIVGGQSLFVIGHPNGLPTKFADDAKVRENTPASYFVANLDTYGGNSGSPVFNRENYQVEGILVRGDTDFVSHNGCNVSMVCPNTGCRGEDVTRATVWAAKIPKRRR